MATSDWFAVGGEMVARLQSAMPELRQVRLAASLAEIADWQPVSPAVWVAWDGDAIADTAGQGATQMVRQRWIAALVVRSAREADTGAGVIAAAGPLMARMIAALSGWQPQAITGCRPLRRIEAPRPGYGAGYGWFPVAFEAVVPAGA